MSRGVDMQGGSDNIVVAVNIRFRNPASGNSLPGQFFPFFEPGEKLHALKKIPFREVVQPAGLHFLTS